ncbi:uncharacterized protein podxl2 [Genypterus blacodes]|uniref:uncharacterized protein podxl2 n=1 Tax=Genypterus blacodes TaxID=154954 RepID=UPI003F766224
MYTAAVMPGLLHIILIASLSSCDAFRLGSSQHNVPFSPQDEGPVQPHLIQELVRVKRHAVQDLVLAQPHLVHDIGRPEIHEASRSQARRETATSSHSPQSSVSQDVARPRAIVEGNVDVVDEMERMVHLTVPRGADGYPETELLSGPGTGDTSSEASGFYGTDAEDRDRGEEGGEDRERRGEDERGEDDWEDRERRGEDVKEEEKESRGAREKQKLHDEPIWDSLEVNHTTPDLDALIGYSPFFDDSQQQQQQQPRLSSPAEVQDSGLQEHQASPVLEVAPSQRELWEGEGEEEGQSSGYGVGVVHPSVATAAATSAPSAAAAGGGGAAGTSAPETDTGTDFALLDNDSNDESLPEDHRRGGTHNCTFYMQRPTVPWVDMEEETGQEGFRPKEREEEEEEEWSQMETDGVRAIAPLTTEPSPTIGLTDPSWDWMEKTTPLQTLRSEVRGGEVKEFFLPNSELDDIQEPKQVVCVDWSDLVGRGYVILNMTKNLNCDEFRADQGRRLLRIMEEVFARRMNSPEGSWVLYLNKPTHQQHQLLMNVASERGVIATKEVLGMLGEIRKSLPEVGIQNYSSATSCQSRLSQTRSDYGKLFVVLVIIGSVCMVIITSGFIYICWQRRLPATKTTFRAEELHFVENGCHDNPTLDVTNDSHPEMQEKKPSTNGLKGGGEGGGKEDSSRWQGFVNQAATEEEEEEQDTHL